MSINTFVKKLVSWLQAHLVAIMLILAGLSGATYFGPQLVSSRTIEAPKPSSNSSIQKVEAKVLPKSEPTNLSIPKLGINTSFTQLGLNADGTMATPNDPNVVGWYKNSPTPGELGPSVITGHVDWVSGIAVFWRLHELTPGDEITITRADSSIAKFRVDSVKQFSQDDFPTAEVYGNINHAGIRLITCGGTFNTQTHHYSDNTVVFGSLIN